MTKVAGLYCLKNIVEIIHRNLIGLNTVSFVLVMVVTSFLVLIPFLPVLKYLVEHVGPLGGPDSLQGSIFLQFIIGVTLAPLVETMLFQSLPIYILMTYTKLNNAAVMSISALFFALSHFYSLTYVFVTFFVGFVLAYAYIVYLKKRQSSYWVVVAIHALRNLVTLVVVNL